MATQAAKAGKLELGHVPISTVLLSSIRPSAKNQLLYRPVDRRNRLHKPGKPDLG